MIAAAVEFTHVLQAITTNQCPLAMEEVVPEFPLVAQSFRAGHPTDTVEPAVAELPAVLNPIGQGQCTGATDDAILEFSLVTPAVLVDEDPLAVPTVPFEAVGGNQGRCRQDRQEHKTDMHCRMFHRSTDLRKYTAN